MKWMEKARKLESAYAVTDKADKSPFVGSVSSPLGAFQDLSSPFVSSVSTSPGAFENSEGEANKTFRHGCRAQTLSPSSSGNDHSPANQDSIAMARPNAIYGPGLPDLPLIGNPGLPSDLFTLAIRYCVEHYGDSVEQVGEMISDLMEQSECWPEWISFIRFRMGIPTEVRCIDCLHGIDTGENLGRCARKVQAPGAGGLWWREDLHPCTHFSQIQSQGENP